MTALIMHFTVLLLSSGVLAQTRTSLLKRVEPDPARFSNDLKSRQLEGPVLNVKAKPNSKADSKISHGGNLPGYFMTNRIFESEGSPIVLPTSRQALRLDSIKLGNVYKAQIKESLLAFHESKTPIRAIATLNNQKEVIFLGEASLEKNSKRISIEFKKIRHSTESQIWSIQGSALDIKGIAGLEGKLFSNEDKYFIAQFLSAGAAGYSDATITREKNVFGNYVEEPGLDTLAKKALTNALGKTTDLFADKLKSAPEYSILEGPIEIQILITEEGKLFL